MIVHHLNKSRSHRVLWMLEELNVPYELKIYERNAKTMLAPPELKQVHPLGKSPVITDGGRTIAESGAILEYLVATYGPHLAPAAGSEAHLRYTYWMHYAEGSLMPVTLLSLICHTLKHGRGVPWLIRPVTRKVAHNLEKMLVTSQLEGHLHLLETSLAEHPWFAGDAFSAADIQLSFPIEALQARHALRPREAKLEEFLSRIRARPAYLKALARGGPVML